LEVIPCLGVGGDLPLRDPTVRLPEHRRLGKGIEALLDAFPEAYKEIFRMEDYTSGAGYLGTELFSLAIPFIFIAVGSTWGASHSALD